MTFVEKMTLAHRKRRNLWWAKYDWIL